MLVKFDSSKYRKDYRVTTKDKHEVRIICTDYNGETGHSVVGLVKMDGGRETVQEFMSNGKWNPQEETDLDLYMEISPKFEEGELIIGKENDYMVLVGETTDPSVVESMLVINPYDLTSRIEDKLNPDEYRKAEKEDYDRFELYLSFLKLKWDPIKKCLKTFEPVIDFNPSNFGWKVTYQGKTIIISNKEYEDLYC